MPGVTDSVLLNRLRSRLPYWCLVVLLFAAVALGGSSRADVPGLLLLRPLAACALVYALATLSGPVIRQNRFVLLLALLIMALPAVHLVPLPPAIWESLPGRDLSADVLVSQGLAHTWQPLTLAPAATRNALFALFLPAAILALGLRLDLRARRSLVWVLLLAGGASGLLGLAQIANPENAALYFYDITNRGSAVGLFANRNHQALLLACLFLLLGYAASAGRSGSWLPWVLAGLAALAVVPLLLITGSRSGLILGLAALVLVAPVVGGFSFSRQPGTYGHRRRRLIALLLCAGVLLAALTILLGRGVAFDRLMQSSAMDDMRLRILPVVWAMIAQYGATGSGIGSFERVYQIHEPDSLLASFYMNHAHNDWLETLLTGGLAAVCLAVVSAAALLRRSLAVFARSPGEDGSIVLSRLGIGVILLMALASLSDYPLRTPAFSAILAVAVLWATCPGKKVAPLPERANSVSD